VARAVEIRPLARDDERSGFSCGEPALDRFFQYYAGPNQFKLKLAVTYVAVLDGRILGFATVAVGSVERYQLPSARQRKRMPAYPLPVLRLARLGVDRAAQSTGVGRQLLRHVFTLAVNQRDVLGCVGYYQKLGFIPLEGVREGQVHGKPTPMFLDIQSIAAALEG
jgi:GNAT superfamily N-acetyltransferase